MSWVTIGRGEGEDLAARARRRLDERLAAGVLDAEEIARVSERRVRLFEGDPLVSEAFRRACVAWRIDAPVPIRSHRKLLGPLLVLFKRLLSRILRFHVEVPLARQAEFNRNLLVVLHELVARSRDDASRRP